MKYTIACTTADIKIDPISGEKFAERAVYFANENNKPPGLPIMFLRDQGMEEAANTLVDEANSATFHDSNEYLLLCKEMREKIKKLNEYIQRYP